MKSKKVRECIIAFGHENIQAIHPTTLMITKEKHLTETGDCIIAVAADKSALYLTQQFKDTLKQPNSKLKILIETNGITETINASGAQKLILTHPTDLVVRKSDYISDRTLAIRADKSSNDLSRELVKNLQNPKQEIKIILIATAKAL